jgi:hypothetical protein
MTAKTAKTAKTAAAEQAAAAAAAAFEAARVTLRDGFAAAMGAKAAMEAARDAGTSALEMLTLSLMAPGVLDAPLAFKCDGVEHSRSLRDYAKHGGGFRNADGSEAKKLNGAFKSAWLGGVAGVNDEKGAASIWRTFIQRALPVGLAAYDEGARAVLNDAGRLVLQTVKGDDGKAAGKASAMLDEGKGISGIAKALTDSKGDGDKVGAGQGKSEGAASAGVDLASAYRVVKLHLASVAALVDDDGKGLPAVGAPTAQQLREIIAPIARDAAAILAAFGDGAE